MGLNILDCGDNSCYFKKSSGGMRTNGGCRCFENAGYSRSATGAAYVLLPEVIQLKEQIELLKQELSNYKNKND